MNFNKRLGFCLFCLILLFGISSLIIISEYTTSEKRRDNPDWFAGESFFKQYITVKPYFWELDIGNGRLSNIENIIFIVSMLWGFLRMIDLMKLFSLDISCNQWLYFWKSVDL